MANIVISIMFKFGSVVMLRMALEEYENMSKNASCFLTAIMLSLAPSALLAPIYTYDHVNCIPRNFLITQAFSEDICVIALIVSMVPIILYFTKPHTIKKIYCCKRRSD